MPSANENGDRKTSSGCRNRAVGLRSWVWASSSSSLWLEGKRKRSELRRHGGDISTEDRGQACPGMHVY